ncbi:polysaccharide biosynthesis protein [Sediminibacterium ginsengisoli]|uniref:NDP-sugar epimerase, includes UDP-GlcNAc-inverting 4,6-dehydratase FlaA1 and capsular polysaccharide biosynthesis protein EpsC n=1 Tax=Sediminibacterium ginsengisoli TaxID=413434 RepID=A0A1T4N3T4_9BACT|nr:nucleoside-diphosphate sugar epimerase/dehydratase [Sediminibacterium ginsengisoli]SJZ73989.1 NDP-sugar epimerase, includes UDP-GlcNAc-inverting 4,6-dehydratase FlaA1 and capsular polysaccharide biosynthesis protein EpsC [Sediminibacterium ginsengisoli]
MFKTINIVPRWIIFLIDLAVCSFAFAFALLIKHNLAFEKLTLHDLSGSLLIILLINSIVFVNFRIYAGIIRYTGVQDALRICYAIAMSTSVLFFISLVSSNSGGAVFFSNVTLIIYALFSFLALISYRVFIKYAFSYMRSYKMDRKNVIIFGAGEAGFATKRILEHDSKLNITVVAFIDDDLRKVGKVVDGIKIHHTLDLQAISLAQKIDEIIIAVFDLPPVKKNEIVDFCLDHDIKVLNVPPLDTWINGQFSARQLQTIKIENLLERDPIRINNDKIVSQISNKRILVTGAAGSIGSEIVRQLLKYNPQTIILCDQAETPLHQLELELQDIKTSTTCVSFLGDIRNEHRMQEMFTLFEPHIVYHAAAYKHVPMMELCPSEAVLTNVNGTKIIADLAVKHHVQRFVMVSTDKAVNPTNVMGASKRLAETYVQALHYQFSVNTNGSDSNSAQKMATKFITTRFGNVLGSNGSVINRFKEQIEKGGPVTVTHPNITRFFMTIPEACQLVLEAGSMGNGGEIFVFDMGKPVPIVDLAKKMIRLYGLVPGIDVDIKYTGLRPGEKLYEELLTDNENTLPTYHEKIMIAKVRHSGLSDMQLKFEELILLARKKQASMEMVAKMKELVPEFVSNNSIFESLDGSKTAINVVPITRAVS